MWHTRKHNHPDPAGEDPHPVHAGDAGRRGLCVLRRHREHAKEHGHAEGDAENNAPDERVADVPGRGAEHAEKDGENDGYGAVLNTGLAAHVVGVLKAALQHAAGVVLEVREARRDAATDAARAPHVGPRPALAGAGAVARCVYGRGY